MPLNSTLIPILGPQDQINSSNNNVATGCIQIIHTIRTVLLVKYWSNNFNNKNTIVYNFYNNIYVLLIFSPRFSGNVFLKETGTTTQFTYTFSARLTIRSEGFNITRRSIICSYNFLVPKFDRLQYNQLQFTVLKKKKILILHMSKALTHNDFNKYLLGHKIHFSRFTYQRCNSTISWLELKIESSRLSQYTSYCCIFYFY